VKRLASRFCPFQSHLFPPATRRNTRLATLVICRDEAATRGENKCLHPALEDPETIYVTSEGHHEITDLAGVGVVVPAGWLRIEVYPHRDRKPFNAD
jgi:hypothetical protein